MRKSRMGQNMKRILCVLALIPLIFTGCGNNDAEGTAGGKEQSAQAKLLNGTPVEVLVVKRTVVEQTVSLTGILQPLHSVDIIAEASGKARKVFKSLGEYVNAGDTLAVIDDRVALSRYRQAKSQVLSAENNLNIARLNLKSDKELFENGEISRLAYENSLLALKSAKANYLSALANLSMCEDGYYDTRITSPISGHISRKYIEKGAMVTPNAPVYRVVDISALKIEAGVPQSAIKRVKTGARARVSIPALNGVYEGFVRHISPQAEERTGAFPVEIHIKNTSDFAIRAGMTAKVELILQEETLRLTVPIDAIISGDGKDCVYKVNRDEAVLSNVSVVERIGYQAVIRDGIAEGDTIVVVGMKNLGVRTKIRIENIH
ncbi:MAG: efflux RND transporter periplasmic adaptor subunit [Calditrichaeota bacterium]|nr:efflux RND transporter periplasmic adaptor subunit [Calditrichota bacterium]